jgi:hypothetical protein
MKENNFRHRNLFLIQSICQIQSTQSLKANGAVVIRRTYKTSPRQNVSIKNVYTHNVSLTKRLLNEMSPVTKRLHNKTSPRHIFNVLDRLFKNICRIEFFVFCG